ITLRYLVKNASDFPAAANFACSFFFAIIFCCFIIFRFSRKITNLISDIEIYSILFSFFTVKTRNFATTRGCARRMQPLHNDSISP
ncbi:MAG: hypothetical protein Q3X12_09045, partial [Hallella sp.]|nr:hypothetical protein [Hallella sp.]